MAIIATDLKFYKSGDVIAAGNPNNTASKETDGIGGAIDTNKPLQSVDTNGLFDAVPSSESVVGRTEYRCIYLHNDHSSQTLYDAYTWLENNTAGTNSSVEIGLDPAPVGSSSSITLDDEIDSTGKLASIVFYLSDGEANRLVIGDMTSGQSKALWVKRTINPAAPAALESVTFGFKGDTDV